MDEILIDRTGQPAAIAASDGNPWLRHQGGQPGNEVQWLEDDMRGAMPKHSLRSRGKLSPYGVFNWQRTSPLGVSGRR
jgi:hypothetical protein